MKMRNRLAALLAVATVVTSVPVVTMASDSIKTSSTITIAEGTVLNEKTAPKLSIVDEYGEWENGERIWLTLDNAEWPKDFSADMLEARGSDGKIIEGADFEVIREDDDVLQIVKRFDSTGKMTVRISMAVEIADDLSDGDEVTVSIDGDNGSGVYSDEPIVFAEISEDAVKVKAGTAKKFATRGTDINDISFTENYVGGFKKGDRITLEIASGFEWDVNTTTSSAIKIEYGKDEVEFEYVEDECDEEVLVIEVTNAPTTRTGTTRFKLTDLAIRTESKNSDEYGDVEVEVSGDNVKDTTLVVAKYMDYGTEAEADVEDFVSGREIELPKVTLSENVADSINFGRRLDVSLTEDVNVVGIKSAKLGNKDVSAAFKEAFEITSERLNKEGSKKEIVNEAMVDLSDYVTDTSKALELKVEFVVETAVDFSGNIDVVFGGRAIGNDEVTVTVANVVAPIEVSAETTKLEVGIKDQKTNKITIKENAKGALRKGTLLVGFEDLSYGRWEDEPTVTVTEGKVKIGTVKLLSSGVLSIEITSTSRTPATIEISDGVMTTSRAIADGKYALEFYGDALVDDNVVSTKWTDSVKVDYLEVGEFAKLEAEKAKQVSFTIGQATYTFGETTEVMDVAPYISEDNRTMVPLRYVAYALGIDEDSILYDKTNSIVTIFNGDKVVQLQAGSKVLLLNGIAIPMDTETVIRDGRTFLPISWIANALGVPYTWDGATGTVTFN